MTLDQRGRTVLFMAPASDEDAEPAPPTRQSSDEVMRRLRNPFQADRDSMRLPSPS